MSWDIKTKMQLTEIIESNTNKGEFAVFDFDNTTICRDIGEATMAQLEIEGVISFSDKLRAISPEVAYNDEEKVSHYYEKLLDVNAHQIENPFGHSNAYVWAAQTLDGLSPNKVIHAAKIAFSLGMAQNDAGTKIISKIGNFARPYIYPEMVELYAQLLKFGIEPYIVSASNVWTVRYIVANFLNPQIRLITKKNFEVKSQNVIGINMLLRDHRDNKLYRDDYLVKYNTKYAELDEEELANYTITNMPGFPISAYAGKVANILAYIGPKQPLLIAGDSPNDFQMLSYAKYKLWIARMEKTDYQQAMLQQNWLKEHTIIQAVLNSEFSGFYASSQELKTTSKLHPKKININECLDLLKMES